MQFKPQRGLIPVTPDEAQRNPGGETCQAGTPGTIGTYGTHFPTDHSYITTFAVA